MERDPAAALPRQFLVYDVQMKEGVTKRNDDARRACPPSVPIGNVGESDDRPVSDHRSDLRLLLWRLSVLVAGAVTAAVVTNAIRSDGLAW